MVAPVVSGPLPQQMPGDVTYYRLREDILAGRLPPGRKLGLDGLRQSYAAGIGTLREVLSRLASEGLVRAGGQRGFTVASVSNQEFAEIADLRLLLEQHAIQEAFASGDLDWEGSIVGAYHKLSKVEQQWQNREKFDYFLYKRYDFEFHRSVISACRSSVLLDMFAGIYDRYVRYQMVGVVPWGDGAPAEHAALLAATLARDVHQARAILKAHICGLVPPVAEGNAMVTRRLSPGVSSSENGAASQDEGTGYFVETAGERTYRSIRSDILRNVWAPGQKLRLETLQKTYGVGIGTLREALNRLVAENLVVAEGQRGFEVSAFSADELQQLANLRLLLESHALEQSFRAGDVEWEARVVATHHKLALMEERLLAGDTAVLDNWRRFDAQFHQILISACGSLNLMAAHRAVFDRYQRYQNRVLGFRGVVAVREHAALRDCAVARDITAARDVLKAHILGGVHYALAAGDV